VFVLASSENFNQEKNNKSEESLYLLKREKSRIEENEKAERQKQEFKKNNNLSNNKAKSRTAAENTVKKDDEMQKNMEKALAEAEIRTSYIKQAVELINKLSQKNYVEPRESVDLNILKEAVNLINENNLTYNDKELLKFYLSERYLAVLETDPLYD
ncbi:MAG: hypothetical protein RR483_03735, partial [Clostridia bacterium]